jgi:hypothetical protein
MFGRGWEPGQATIVALKEVWSAGHEAGTVGGGPKLKTYDFLADVQPAGGGAMFRTVMHEPFDERHWHRPGVGAVVPVSCDPKRQKAKFDTSEASGGHKAQKEAQKRARAAQAAQFDSMVNAAPGTPPLSTVGEPEAGVAGESAQDPADGVRKVKADLARMLIEKAKREGNTAEVERLTARLAQLESGSGSASKPQ